MPLVYVDRVQETTPTTGTGTLTLAGASAGYQGFGVVGVGNQTYYAILDTVTNAWEVGIGTYSIGALSRDTVLASSNANVLVNFGAGSKIVFATAPAQFFSTALSTAGHAAINHSGLPGVPAPEAFTAGVHSTTDHTGITGVPPPEAFTALVHAATNHTGLPGVGDVTVVSHASIDHSSITGVLSPAAHLLVDHSGVPGVAPLKNETLSTNITNVASTLYTLPAGTLAADGDSVDIELLFEAISTSTTYSTLSLGGTSLIGTSAGTLNTPGSSNQFDNWRITITRTGAATGRARILLDKDIVPGSGLAGVGAQGRVLTTLPLTWASAQALTVATTLANRIRIIGVRVLKHKAA